MTRQTALAAVALLLAAGTAGTSGPEPARASVAGRIVVVADPPAPPPALSPYARRRSEPPQRPGVPGGAEDAFVYLESLSDVGSPPSTAPAVITQRERTIIPHASVVRVGQVVEFPNEDDVFHNLFSLSPGNNFSLGRYAPGVTERNVFESPGVVRLFCDIHAEMAGVILVVTTSYVVRAGPDGSYRLADVPGGSYRAIAWHPSAGADTVTLSLGPDQAVTQDFTLVARR